VSDDIEDSPVLIKFKRLLDETMNQTNTESTKVDGVSSKNITTDATVAPHTEQPAQAAEDKTLNTPPEIKPDSGLMKEINPEDNPGNEEHETPKEDKPAEPIFEPRESRNSEPLSSTNLDELSS
jgi:hypothetical protein